MDDPKLAPQQAMMLSLAQALDDCAQDIIVAHQSSQSSSMSAKGWRAVGRLQGLAIGCRAIAALAADPTTEATP